jgi:hypothetical protein
MAVGLRLEFNTLSLSDYDAVCAALNFPADWPDGLITHVSFEENGALRVVDVWESRQKFDGFVASRLQCAMGQALAERAEAPDVMEAELHTFYAGSPK